MDRYLIGAAYYPEWWPDLEWETDFKEMHELGINTARMGEYDAQSDFAIDAAEGNRWTISAASCLLLPSLSFVICSEVISSGLDFEDWPVATHR